MASCPTITNNHSGTTMHSINRYKSALLTILVMMTWVLLLPSCTREVRIVSHSADKAVIFPDYTNVTLPCNIAPIDFSVEGLTDAALIIKGQSDSICLTTSDGSFTIPEDHWHQLLQTEKGRRLTMTVCRPAKDGWESLAPFYVTVSPDSIDNTLVYRLIPPGYGLWNNMKLCQRNLESFDEEVIYDNRFGKGNCINCHTFNGGDSQTWQVHVRHNFGGTYIVHGSSIEKLDVKGKGGKPVYAGWHPDGRHIAYSTNNTFFHIHTLDANRWEVMDDGSDVIVVDTNTGERISSLLLSSPDSYETFPTFSPDGQWLYFCTARKVEQLTRDFADVRYSLCRIAFDKTHNTFAEKVDTICSSIDIDGSVSMPRISPDGKWLCFVKAAYGNFGVCHNDADLMLVRLSDGVTMPMTEANSPMMESYHTWSRNSRWLVFSSKRDDGQYTRPYFTHVDANGKCSKPFCLPQRNAQNFYRTMLDAYNIPELVNGHIDIDARHFQQSLEK